jgi:protein involved in polysaccharide export with SLBB domain
MGAAIGPAAGQTAAPDPDPAAADPAPPVADNASEPTAPRPPSSRARALNEQLAPLDLGVTPRARTVQTRLEPYGYDFFERTTGGPQAGIDRSVPPSYRIGPGDRLAIQLYGNTNEAFERQVTRAGRILLPELGPFQVAGLRLDEVKALLKERLAAKNLGTRAAITLAELHPLQIRIVGEVARPGSHTVHGLATLVTGLLAGGPVEPNGSLRRIQLRRGDRTVAVLDLYELLMDGTTNADVPLANGDTIFVPPIGSTVGVAGAVGRPGIFELRGPATIDDALRLAGGLLADADTAEARLRRIQGGARRVVELDLGRAADRQRTLQDGDLLRVLRIPRRIANAVLLTGPVLRPGSFAFRPGLRVSDLVPAQQALLPSTDRRFALLRRETGAAGRIEVAYLDLAAALAEPGGEADRRLARRDELRLFDLDRARAEQTEDLVAQLRAQAVPDTYPPMVVTVRGATRFNGTLPLAWEARLLDVIELAGGVDAEADRRYGLIVRQVDPPGRVTFLSFNLAAARADPQGAENLYIFPEDRVIVFPQEGPRTPMFQEALERLQRETPYGEASRLVSIDGPVAAPGTYPLEPGMRVSDLIRAAGGLGEAGFGLRGELTRYRSDPGERQGVEHQPVRLAKALGGRRGDDALLHARDHLLLHRKPQWRQEKAFATVRGAVRFPGRYPIGPNDTLCGLVERAGGMTDTAYPFGAVFKRERVRARQQEALDRMHERLDDLLVQLHLSPSAKNDEKLPEAGEKRAILEAIRGLKRIPASGRLVIDLTRGARCATEANLALRDGDELMIPTYQPEVTVAGEVYFPTTHTYRDHLSSRDYIQLSGGATRLAREDHAYVVQANGEVMTVRGGDWSDAGRAVTVTPGATLYVPIDVDRINPRESAQAWTEVVFRLLTSAASLRFLFSGF